MDIISYRPLKTIIARWQGLDRDFYSRKWLGRDGSLSSRYTLPMY